MTIPLAGHALREIESTIRVTLAAPMDAEAEQEEDSEQAVKVGEALRPLGYPQEAIDRAIKSLQPKTSHAEQIRKIAEHLALSAVDSGGEAAMNPPTRKPRDCHESP